MAQYRVFDRCQTGWGLPNPEACSAFPLVRKGSDARNQAVALALRLLALTAVRSTAFEFDSLTSIIIFESVASTCFVSDMLSFRGYPRGLLNNSDLRILTRPAMLSIVIYDPECRILRRMDIQVKLQRDVANAMCKSRTLSCQSDTSHRTICQPPVGNQKQCTNCTHFLSASSSHLQYEAIMTQIRLPVPLGLDGLQSINASVISRAIVPKDAWS